MRGLQRAEIPQDRVLLLAEIEPQTGRVFDTTNLRKEWNRACAACGLGRIIKAPDKKYDPRYEGLTLHDLTRSAARNLLLAGVPETIVMKLGGWITRSVFDRYAVALDCGFDGRDAVVGDHGREPSAPIQWGKIR